MKLTALQKRCVDICYRHKLVQLTSVLHSVEIIEKIYQQKSDDDPFVLGNGWAGVALYAVLESRGECDADKIVSEHGCNVKRSNKPKVWVSGGSIGQPETVAVGLALANPSRRVWLLTSDGCCSEGAWWEAMRIASEFCRNILVRLVFNGWAAYRPIMEHDLRFSLSGLRCGMVEICSVDEQQYPEWLRGPKGHYNRLTKEQYVQLME